MQNFKIYGKEARYKYCPICQKEKDNPCFSVNVDTGLYCCFTTGEKGHISKLKDFKCDIEKLNELAEKTPTQPNKDLKEVLMSSKSIADNKVWIEYLNKRGITDIDKIKKICRIGKYNSLLIPVTDGFDVVSIKYRTIDKKMFSEKGSQNNYFINWKNIEKFDELVLVEGEIDLFSVLEIGISNVVSLPNGASNLKCVDIQIDWLRKFKKIIIAVDNDEAGEKAKKEIVNKLNIMSKNLYEVDFGTLKDFNDALVTLDKTEALNLIIEAQKIDMEEINNYQMYIKGVDCYYYFTGKKYIRASNFLLDIKGHNGDYVEGTSYKTGETHEFKSFFSDLNDKGKISKNEIGFFLAPSTKIMDFWNWIREENIDKLLEKIPHYGIVENQYYHSKSNILCDKNDLDIVNYDELELPTEEEMKWLEENLIYMRKDPIQSLLGICWALGRLHNENIPYPILEVAGTTSIGKTEYVEFITRILQGSKENIKSFTTLSNHQIRSISSCSNITSWVIDEIKIIGLNQVEKAKELYSTIRSVYDNKTLSQGNTTNKLTEFHLCTPLIISGESELSDLSVKNRMISVKLTIKNKSDYEIFEKLKNTNLLEKFGKLAIEDRLKNGKIKINKEFLSKCLSNIKDDRKFYNHSCILVGLKALTKLINIDDQVKNEFLEMLNTQNVDEGIVENFEQLLDLVLESGLDYLDFYDCGVNTHHARFNMLYKAIAEEHKKTNSMLELVDMKTLKKQLIEVGYITNSRRSERFKSNSYKCVDFVIKNDFKREEQEELF